MIMNMIVSHQTPFIDSHSLLNWYTYHSRFFIRPHFTFYHRQWTNNLPSTVLLFS